MVRAYDFFWKCIWKAFTCQVKYEKLTVSENLVWAVFTPLARLVQFVGNGCSLKSCKLSLGGGCGKSDEIVY